MLYSGILPITGSNARVAECGVGQEVNVFGLVFSNSTAAVRTVSLTLFRQTVGSAQTLNFEIGAKGRLSWEKPVSLQPGDYIDVSADAVGVSLLWSTDQDTGVNPVASAFVVRGAYSNVANYAALDIVLKSGSSYVAIRNNTNKDPLTETADWMLLLDGSGTQAAIDAIVAGAPANLDTLDKLAAAIGDNPTFATTVADALALKASTSSLSAVAFSGNFSDLVGIKKLAVRRLFTLRELV